MKKQIGKNLMQKCKNKIRVRLSALDKKKLVLTNLPYVLTAFYADRASCLYRSSPGEDIGNKLLYAMEHADRILTGLQPNYWFGRNSQMQRNFGRESSMVQPDGETLRILNLICRKIPG